MVQKAARPELLRYTLRTWLRCGSCPCKSASRSSITQIFRTPRSQTLQQGIERRIVLVNVDVCINGVQLGKGFQCGALLHAGAVLYFGLAWQTEWSRDGEQCPMASQTAEHSPPGAIVSLGLSSISATTTPARAAGSERPQGSKRGVTVAGGPSKTSPIQMNGYLANPLPGRLGSLDAYRGFVMFLMMAEVLHCCRVSAALPDSGFWGFLCHHQSHVEWVGCSLHDLIQPSFSFLVGVALPFSLASRPARGQSRRRMTLHALWRALVLVLLGVFLRSHRPAADQLDVRRHAHADRPGLRLPVPARAAVRRASSGSRWRLILVGYWAAFALYPLPGAGLRLAKRGRPAGLAEQHLLTGFAAHWNKNTNLAWAFDTWFLNLFPRAEALRLQRRRLCHAELHPHAGHDDPGPDRRRRAAQRARAVGQGELAGHRRASSAWRRAGCSAGWASARWSSASGRRAGCSSAAAGASCSWRGSMRSSTCSGAKAGRSRWW